MHHDFIDKYSNLNSFIHKIDARVKFIVIVVLVFAIVLAENFSQLLLFFLISFFILLISKVPLFFVLKKTTVILPFVLPIILLILLTKEQVVYRETIFSKYYFAFFIFLKSFLAVFSVLILTSTTKFSDLLMAMKKLGFPKIFTELTLFCYRYIFFFFDEIERISHARKCRDYGKSFINKNSLKIIGNIVGSVFIRSYEKAEKIYNSLLSRGYSGELKTFTDFKIKKIDIAFSFLVLFPIAIIILEGKFWNLEELIIWHL